MAALRAAWPDVRLVIRGEHGLAVPERYTLGEANALTYVSGVAMNPVLDRATAPHLAEREVSYHFYGRREPHVQRFEELRDYQAGTWPYPRRGVVKLECRPQGSQRRVVVTNREEAPAVLYREWYTPRGKVPDQPSGELKNGLRAERLSACGFRAQAFRLLVHTLAYASVVLFRAAVAGLLEVAKATVSTLRQRLWKVDAVVRCRTRSVTLQIAAWWPQREQWLRVWQAGTAFVQPFLPGGSAGVGLSPT